VRSDYHYLSIGFVINFPEEPFHHETFLQRHTPILNTRAGKEPLIFMAHHNRRKPILIKEFSNLCFRNPLPLLSFSVFMLYGVPSNFVAYYFKIFLWILPFILICVFRMRMIKA
jgi:hypothetical protein